MNAVRVEPEAKQELAAAAAWYEKRQEGLGQEFLAEVDAVLGAIARSPSRFPLYPRVARELGVRRAAAGRFPYMLAFIEFPTVVRVLAVAHERRRPGYWVGRLAEGKMNRVGGSRDLRQLELKICEAIGTQRVLEFDYDGQHRVVQPYCHGFTRKGAETLRAVQVNADSRSGGRSFGKLWTVAKMQNLRVAGETFAPDDPDYNPNDTALLEIHCSVKPAP